MAKFALCAVVLGALGGAFVAGCDDDDGGGEPTTAEPSAEQGDAQPDRPAGDSNDPLQQATAWARKQFPEATETDDFLAAATSGCYLGLTGEYLGGPAGWSVEKSLRIEYPEAALQAIFYEASEDCS